MRCGKPTWNLPDAATFRVTLEFRQLRLRQERPSMIVALRSFRFGHSCVRTVKRFIFLSIISIVLSPTARELTSRFLVMQAASPASTSVESMVPIRTPIRTAFFIIGVLQPRRR